MLYVYIPFAMLLVTVFMLFVNCLYIFGLYIRNITFTMLCEIHTRLQVVQKTLSTCGLNESYTQNGPIYKLFVTVSVAEF